MAFALTAMLAGVVLMLDRPATRATAGQQPDAQAVERRLDGVEALVRQMTETLERTIHRFDKVEAPASRR